VVNYIILRVYIITYSSPVYMGSSELKVLVSFHADMNGDEVKSFNLRWYVRRSDKDVRGLVDSWSRYLFTSVTCEVEMTGAFATFLSVWNGISFLCISR
jgi:hypothetical protein